jgi:hypothetical protein
MELTITSIIYLFLRLAPFILVCFFSLSSFLNQDFKGLVYLFGLIFSCFVTILIGNSGIINRLEQMIHNMSGGEMGIIVENPICNQFTFGGRNQNWSILPMSQSIFGYTLGYFITVILINKIVYNNIPLLTLLPTIAAFDIIWNYNNSCYTITSLLSSLLIGAFIGWAWARILLRTKMTNLIFLNDIDGKTQCERPTQSTFKCKVYKGGQLVSTFAQ